MTNTLEDQLERYIPEPNSGCWLWDGPYYRAGYGIFCCRGYAEKRAHRFFYEYYVGPIPDGLFVCHKCDVPSCVNPDHLFVGSNADNMADMVHKGRSADLRGEKSSMAKLTSAAVREILTSDDSGAVLAAKFGVARSTVNAVMSGKTWKHVASSEARGRGVRRGERHHRAKITEQDVRNIRTANKTARGLAAEFGVCKSNIDAIRQRKKWKHVA